MAVTSYASGSQTCTISTEHTLTANPETTAGAYQLLLDLNALASLDILEIRIKEKVQSSGSTERVVWFDVVNNAQGEEKIWVSPVIMLLNGWDMSIKQTAGTGRVILWSIRKA